MSFIVYIDIGQVLYMKIEIKMSRNVLYSDNTLDLVNLYWISCIAIKYTISIRSCMN